MKSWRKGWAVWCYGFFFLELVETISRWMKSVFCQKSFFPPPFFPLRYVGSVNTVNLDMLYLYIIHQWYSYKLLYQSKRQQSLQQNFQWLLCRVQQKQWTGSYKLFHFCSLFFNCPQIVNGVSKRKCCQNLAPGHMMKGGLTAGCKPWEG